MSNVLFLGDLHAGHKAVAKYRTQFSSELDHFEYVKDQYFRRVTKRDKCIFTGDTAFTAERLEQIAKWPGQKVLIVGNHDTDDIPMSEIVKHYDAVYSLLKYKEFWVSHAPMHPSELRGKINIHGHVHNATIDDIRYFNTSLENTGFGLISLFEIRDIIQKRKQFYIDTYTQAHKRIHEDFGKGHDFLPFDHIALLNQLKDSGAKIPTGLK